MGITAGKDNGAYPDLAEQPEAAEINNGQDPEENAETEAQTPATAGEHEPGAMTGTADTADPDHPDDAGDVAATEPGAAPADGTAVVVSDDGNTTTEVEVEAGTSAEEAAQAAEEKKAREDDGKADADTADTKAEDKAEEAPAPTQDLEGGADKSEYDPKDHTVDEVKDYLDKHPEDKERVLALEETGKKRVSVLGL